MTGPQPNTSQTCTWGTERSAKGKNRPTRTDHTSAISTRSSTGRRHVPHHPHEERQPGHHCTGADGKAYARTVADSREPAAIPPPGLYFEAELIQVVAAELAKVPGPAVRRRVGRTSYQSKAAYAAKLKNGLRGRAWTVTHKIKELAVTRVMEVIAADVNVLGKAVREVIRGVRKSCEQVAPLQHHKACMAFYGEGTVNQANTCETGGWTASRNWWI